MRGRLLWDMHDFDDPGVRVIEVRGEVCLMSGPDLFSALMQIVQSTADAGPPVVLDLSGVSYFDLVGVRILEDLSTYLNGLRRPLALSAPSYPVHRILEVVALERQFESFESRQAAIGFSQAVIRAS